MFKIGDKVRVIKESGDDCMHVPIMNEFIGRIGVMVKEHKRGIKVQHGDERWWWTRDALELVNEHHVGDIIQWPDSMNTYQIKALYADTRADLLHIKTGRLFNNFTYKASNLIKKYPLRNKGRFIKCDRDVFPVEKKPAKAIKPKAKEVVAKAAIMPAVEAVKPLPEPIAKPAFDLRAELKKEVNNSGMANYALEFKKSNVRYQINDACHARMCWGYGEVNNKEFKKDGDGIVNIAMALHQSYEMNTDSGIGEQYKEYVNYLLNESPWKDCYITKDIDEALDKGILFNVQRNVSELMGAAIALREGHEYKSKLRTWKDVKALGYSNQIAFLVSTFIPSDTWLMTSSGHTVFALEIPVDALIKFFKEGYAPGLTAIADDPKQTIYSVHKTIAGRNDPAGYYGTKNINPDKKEDFNDWIPANTDYTTVGEGWDKRVRFDYKKSIVKLAEAFKAKLEN